MPTPPLRDKLPPRLRTLFARRWGGKDIAILVMALLLVSVSGFAFRGPMASALAQFRAGAQGAETVAVFDVVVDRENRQYFDILFDRPLGEGHLNEVLDPAPATIEPALGGSWMWQTTNALRFQPSGGLPVASEYTVTLDPGSDPPGWPGLHRRHGADRPDGPVPRRGGGCRGGAGSRRQGEGGAARADPVQLPGRAQDPPRPAAAGGPGGWASGRPHRARDRLAEPVDRVPYQADPETARGAHAAARHRPGAHAGRGQRPPQGGVRPRDPPRVEHEAGRARRRAPGGASRVHARGHVLVADLRRGGREVPEDRARGAVPPVRRPQPALHHRRAAARLHLPRHDRQGHARHRRRRVRRGVVRRGPHPRPRAVRRLPEPGHVPLALRQPQPSTWRPSTPPRCG